MSDQILLDRIKELEGENAKLKVRTVRWQNVARAVGYWFKKNGDDIGAAALVIGFFGSIILVVTWLFGGWATDKFYLEFGSNSHSGGACIYQEYNWGMDAKVECSYNIGDRPNYVHRIETIRNEWVRVRDIGRDTNEQSRAP